MSQTTAPTFGRKMGGMGLGMLPLVFLLLRRPSCNSLGTYFLDAEDTGRASILVIPPYFLKGECTDIVAPLAPWARRARIVHAVLAAEADTARRWRSADIKEMVVAD